MLSLASIFMRHFTDLQRNKNTKTMMMPHKPLIFVEQMLQAGLLDLSLSNWSCLLKIAFDVICISSVIIFNSLWSCMRVCNQTQPFLLVNFFSLIGWQEFVLLFIDFNVEKLRFYNHSQELSEFKQMPKCSKKLLQIGMFCKSMHWLRNHTNH